MAKHGAVTLAKGPLNALIIRNTSAKRDQVRRPYLKLRRNPMPSVEEVRLGGSAVVAAWPWILGFTLYSIAMALLFDFVLEDMFPETFERTSMIASIFTATWVIGSSFFLSASAFGSTGKYADAIRAMFDVMDAIGTASLYTSGAVCREKMKKLVRVPRYADYLPKPIPGCPPQKSATETPPDNPVFAEVQAIEVLEEIQDLWRAMPFIVKHNFRSNPTASRFDERIPADVDLSQRGVVVRLLPMRPHLIWELERLETDAIGGALNMIVARNTVLFKCGLLDAGVITGLHDQINNVGTQAARVSSIQVLGLIPPFKDLLLASIVLSSIVLPWQMWVSLRYWSILFHTLTVVFLFGIYCISKQVGNPFNRAGSSPFSYHDIGHFMRSSARNVDDVFDKFVAEAALYSATGMSVDVGDGVAAVMSSAAGDGATALTSDDDSSSSASSSSSSSSVSVVSSRLGYTMPHALGTRQAPVLTNDGYSMV